MRKLDEYYVEKANKITNLVGRIIGVSALVVAGIILFSSISYADSKCYSPTKRGYGHYYNGQEQSNYNTMQLQRDRINNLHPNTPDWVRNQEKNRLRLYENSADHSRRHYRYHAPGNQYDE